MNAKHLKEYLTSKMRMSHVYQPVMIRRLILNDGEADSKAIAQDLVNHDFSQIEYYMLRVDKMVGQVLRKNGVVDKSGSIYQLKQFTNFSKKDIDEIIALCDQKINDYVQKRGAEIWNHRRKHREPIDGSIRYQVLNRANNRCELCGISSEKRALEVDHIIPKNWGGEDSIHNYQALCFQCNSEKRDTDNTDFRARHKIFDNRVTNCLFCKKDLKIILENELAIVVRDSFPVTKGHSLVIPRRHTDSYFEITQPEINAMHSLIQQVRTDLKNSDSRISGFNLGINQGTSAGQTIMHTHLHVIPRRDGDMENPRGGVRHVIPEKGKYD